MPQPTLAVATAPLSKHDDFKKLSASLGERWLNAKHTTWVSRIASHRGRELTKVIYEAKSSIITSEQPTFWPADRDKQPDILDFFTYAEYPASISM